MHKSDYIAIAQAIKENTTNTLPFNDGSLVLPCSIIRQSFLPALCDILQADNKNFDRQRFLEAVK